MSHRLAFVLSGCGNQDGSEIHESVIAVLAARRVGVEVCFFAPDVDQAEVRNFRTKELMSEKRNVLTEAARIARGAIAPLTELAPREFGGVVFPGGLGVVKNLSDFAVRKEACDVLPEVRAVIEGFFSLKRPQAFICIAPVLAARVLGPYGVELTVGEDPATEGALEAMGARMVHLLPRDFHVDETNLIFSTPAYMRGRSIEEIEPGISALMGELVSRL